MRTRRLIPAALALAAFALPASAGAKTFRPGDIRVCGAQACVAIVDQQVLNALGRFYYGAPPPVQARAPRLGAPYIQIRFTNGYVTGIAATAQLDRFRTGGVNMAQFGPDHWYRVPRRVAAALRKLAAPLQAMRVTESTIAPTRYG